MKKEAESQMPSFSVLREALEVGYGFGEDFWELPREGKSETDFERLWWWVIEQGRNQALVHWRKNRLCQK